MSTLPIRIGIIGDFNPEYRSHHAINASLAHAGVEAGREVRSDWLATSSLLQSSADQILPQYDGLWASSGSPYRSMDGALAGIQFARVRDWPFIGTCGGFQHALLEYARHVMGIVNADSAEHGGSPENFLIAPVECPAPNRGEGAPKLSGRLRVRIEAGSRLAAIYGRSEIEEEYFCNYEVNPAYYGALQNAGLRLAAFGERNEVRAIELPDHPFLLATLFQPQLSSTEGTPHPVIVAFLAAAAAHQARSRESIAHPVT